MKFYPNANIPRFLQAVQECRGEVSYSTPEGDRLDLKSALAQFMFAAVIAGEVMDLHGDIELSEPADMLVLREYLV